MKLFKCAECGNDFSLDDFTPYNVCKTCYDKYWEEYCNYLDSLYEAEQEWREYVNEKQLEKEMQ